jgi:branched-chain amino acid aminotransferase
MMEAKWNEKTGWGAPQIVPSHYFSVHPFNSTFHYAFEGFEGLKAYRDPSGRLRTFRPDMNAKRLNRTSAEMCFPTFEPTEFVKCLDELLKIDDKWIPDAPSSLYIRPTIVSLTNKLGVHPPADTMLFICAAPSGSYFKSGVKPLKLKVETIGCRAWPGGTGHVKAGANYAIGIKYVHDAIAEGFDQVLWLNQGNLTEAGAMNFCVLWENEEGKKEVVTPFLDGTILPGITRDSILQLTKEDGRYLASEKIIKVDDLVRAYKEKRVTIAKIKHK